MSTLLRPATMLTSGRCELCVRWPVVARALVPAAAANAEAILQLTLRLDGPPQELRGQAELSATPSSSELLPAPRSPTGLDGTAFWIDRGSGCLVEADGWVTVQWTSAGGAQIVVTAPSSDRPATGPAYLRTTLLCRVGLSGGRYGRPEVSCRWSGVPAG
jgi:hypothetical protein